MTSTVRLKTFRIFSGLYARKQREDYVLFPRSYFRRTVLVGKEGERDGTSGREVVARREEIIRGHGKAFDNA